MVSSQTSNAHKGIKSVQRLLQIFRMATACLRQFRFATTAAADKRCNLPDQVAGIEASGQIFRYRHQQGRLAANICAKSKNTAAEPILERVGKFTQLLDILNRDNGCQYLHPSNFAHSSQQVCRFAGIQLRLQNFHFPLHLFLAGKEPLNPVKYTAAFGFDKCRQLSLLIFQLQYELHGTSYRLPPRYASLRRQCRLR